MFTLVDLIIIGVLALITIGITVAIFREGYEEKKVKTAVVITEIIVLALITFGCAMYNTHTESGKRSVKSWHSETQGGIERTVTVFDMEGEEIAKYHGKFDIQENAQDGIVKIKFDCEGKRHIIYAQTGTVLIDED